MRRALFARRLEVSIERRNDDARVRKGSATSWLGALALRACLMPLAIACSEASGGRDDADAGGAPTRVRDTTGARFEFVAEGSDALLSVEGLATECGGKRLEAFTFLRGKTGLALVCGIDPNAQTPADYLCRPIACVQRSECPEGYGCEEGLCDCTADACPAIDGGNRIHSLELMARCLGSLPRPARCLEAFTDPSWGTVSRALLDQCDSEGLCTIPSECH